jgi:hypothetical protein
LIDPGAGLPYCRTGWLPVCLAAVDHDPLGPAVALQRSGEEAFSGCQIAPFAEPELDRVPIAVDRAIEIPPLAADLDIGLIDMPLVSDRAFAPVESLQQFGGIPDNPSVNNL